MWTSLCTNLCYPVEIKDIIIIIITEIIDLGQTQVTDSISPNLVQANSTCYITRMYRKFVPNARSNILTTWRTSF